MKNERRSRPKSNTTRAKRRTASSRAAVAGPSATRAETGHRKGTRKKGPATRMKRKRSRAGRTREVDLALRRPAGRKRAPTLEEVAEPHRHSLEPDE